MCVCACLCVFVWLYLCACVYWTQDELFAYDDRTLGEVAQWWVETPYLPNEREALDDFLANPRSRIPALEVGGRSNSQRSLLPLSVWRCSLHGKINQHHSGWLLVSSYLHPCCGSHAVSRVSVCV